VLLVCKGVLFNEAATREQRRGRRGSRRRRWRVPTTLATDAMDGAEACSINVWTSYAAKAAVWKRRAVLELGVVWCVGFNGWMYPTPNEV